ncbi:hypothetical protein [Vibrio coralliilyticus]|uniref:Uncharacterized protein n=1 Tax=Vibrio coralliilyticus TaxID=190893 RepID=A0AAP6ZUD8_9VIBR|nr:hypothetical protein [Vibrio coralliilyticus]NOI32016.1 hypothetical protein [Vibrio coralliilyticus]NOJ25217.1 hypothetical protein [Vibrio coralliilyticus]
MKVLGIEVKQPHSLEVLVVLSLVVLSAVFREQLALMTDTNPLDVFGGAVAASTGIFLNACGLNIRYTYHLFVIAVLCGVMGVVARSLSGFIFS